MPPNWATKAGFDSVYYRPAEAGRPAGRPKVIVNYCRWAVYPEAQKYADFYTTITSPTDSIVVIGSGFAWSLEILVDQYGYDPALVTGVDTSGYVQGAKATTEEQDIRDAIAAVGLDPDGIVPHPVTGETTTGPEILARCLADTRPRATITVLDETLSNQGSRNRVLAATGGSADFVISELVLSGLTDAEAQLVDSQMASLDIGQTWHVVMDEMFQGSIDRHGWNVKSLEEWKQLMPNSSFVSARDFRVVP